MIPPVLIAGIIQDGFKWIVKNLLLALVEALFEIVAWFVAGGPTRSLLLLDPNRKHNMASDNMMPGLEQIYSDMVPVFFAGLSLVILASLLARMFFPNSEQTDLQKLSQRVIAAIFVVILGQWIWWGIFEAYYAVGNAVWLAGGDMAPAVETASAGTFIGVVAMLAIMVYFSSTIIMTVLLFWVILAMRLVFIGVVYAFTPIWMLLWVPQGGIGKYTNQITGIVFSMGSLLLVLGILLAALFSVGSVMGSFGDDVFDTGSSGELPGGGEFSNADVPRETQGHEFDFADQPDRAAGEPRGQFSSNPIESALLSVVGELMPIMMWLGSVWIGMGAIVTVVGRFAMAGMNGGGGGGSGDSSDGSLGGKLKGVGKKLGGGLRQKSGEWMEKGGQKGQDWFGSGAGSSTAGTSQSGSVGGGVGGNGQTGSTSGGAQTTTASVSQGQLENPDSGNGTFENGGGESVPEGGETTDNEDTVIEWGDGEDAQDGEDTDIEWGDGEDAQDSDGGLPDDPPEELPENHSPEMSERTQIPDEEGGSSMEEEPSASSAPDSSTQTKSAQSEGSTQQQARQQAQNAQQERDGNLADNVFGAMEKGGRTMQEGSVTGAASKAKDKMGEWNRKLKGEADDGPDAMEDIDDEDIASMDEVDANTEDELRMDGLTDEDVRDLTHGEVDSVEDFEFEDASYVNKHDFETDDVDKLDGFEAEDIEQLEEEVKHDDWETAKDIQETRNDLKQRGYNDSDLRQMDQEELHDKRVEEMQENLKEDGLTDKHVKDMDGTDARKVDTLSESELSYLEEQQSLGPHNPDKGKLQKAYSYTAGTTDAVTNAGQIYLQGARIGGSEGLEHIAEKADESERLSMNRYSLEGHGAADVGQSGAENATDVSLNQVDNIQTPDPDSDEDAQYVNLGSEDEELVWKSDGKDAVETTFGDEGHRMQVGYLKNSDGERHEAVRFYNEDEGEAPIQDGQQIESIKGASVREYPNEGYQSGSQEDPSFTVHETKKREHASDSADMESPGDYDQVEITRNTDVITEN
jgi:hypothetical protein